MSLLSLAGVLSRWFLFIGTLLAVGAAAFRFLVLPRGLRGLGSPDGLREPGLERCATLGLLGGLLVLPALMGILVIQVTEFRDPFGPLGPQLELLLVGTPWGRVWIVRFGAGVAASLLFLMARRSAAVGWWVAAGLASVALGASPGFTGHSFGAERLTGAAVAADALHVLAGGAWLGSLAVLVSVGHLFREGGRAGAVRPLVRAFSPVALASAGLLVATGVFASWLHGGGDPAALLESGWGRLLGGKLLLVAGVVGFGWYNWKKATPRLDREDGVRAFLRGSARGELLVAILVLLVTAVLVWTSPPM